MVNFSKSATKQLLNGFDLYHRVSKGEAHLIPPETRPERRQRQWRISSEDYDNEDNENDNEYNDNEDNKDKNNEDDDNKYNNNKENDKKDVREENLQAWKIMWIVSFPYYGYHWS